MTSYHKFKISILNGILALLICICSQAEARYYKLERIHLSYDKERYRITVQCNESVNYVSKIKKSPSRLLLFFRNTVLNLPKRKMVYREGPVKEILANQLKTSPVAAQVSIVFAKSVSYEIKNGTDGVVYIDLYEKRNSPYKHGANGIAHNGKINSKTSSPNFDKTRPEKHGLTNGSTTGVATHGVSNVYSESTSLKDESAELEYAALNNQELLSLDVRGAEIGNVLRMLAKLSKLNIVASRDVTGGVTVSLSNVTVKDALDKIVRANGYDYVVDSNVIVVKPVDKFEFGEFQTKIYRLKYIDSKNIQSILSQVLSSQAKIQIFYQDFNMDAAKGEGQEKKSKSRSSTLIVTDSPSNIRQVDALIAALDVPTPQIMIEAKLIEVAPQSQEKLGINWSKTLNAELFQEIILPSGEPYRYSVQTPLEGGGISFGTLSLTQFDAVLDFLSTETNAELVSNPRILTMDNQEAVIKVGTRVPIPQISRGVGGQGDIVTFEYRDVNISLRVRPHVSDDSTITLFVNPIIEEITGEVAVGESRAPVVSKREVETVVKVKNNETIIIGGLIKENSIKRVDKVWFLGDIPLIGDFFRHNEETTQQTDLLIFITPRLVQEF